jgi:hypothetical protein
VGRSVPAPQRERQQLPLAIAFHEAGGRGGYTRGAKRTILIEILGLPLAVSVESAKPHDVQSGRRARPSRSGRRS